MSFGIGRIWMNGKLVDWAAAKVHIGSHVIHYGSGVSDAAVVFRAVVTSRPSREPGRAGELEPV